MIDHIAIYSTHLDFNITPNNIMIYKVYFIIKFISLMYSNRDIINLSGRLLLRLLNNIELKRILYNPIRITVKNNLRNLRSKLFVIDNYI